MAQFRRTFWNFRRPKRRSPIGTFTANTGGAVSLTAPKLSSTSVLRDHTVTPVIAITAPKLDSTSVLRAPTVALQVTAPKISSASVLRAPTVAPQPAVTAPKLASTSTLRAPTVAPDIAVTAPKLASGSTLRAPTVAPVIAVTSPKLASASTLRAPTVAVDGGTTLEAPKLASTSVLRAPTISLVVDITAPKLASTSVLRDHTVVEGTVAPPVETPTGTTGGGPNVFYRGRRRFEVRKAIDRALRELADAKTPRARKRKARRVAKEFIEAFDISIAAIPVPETVPPQFLPLEQARSAVFDLALKLREKEAASAENAKRLAELFQQYRAEVAKIEQREEEDAIALILAVAA